MQKQFLNIHANMANFDVLPPELLSLIEKSTRLWEAYQNTSSKNEIQALCHDVRVSFLIYFKNKTSACGTATSFERDSQKKIQMDLLLKFHRSFEEFETSGRLPADFFSHHKAWLLSEVKTLSTHLPHQRAG